MTYLPGTPYISPPPDYINTRLRASPHQYKIKQLFPHNPIQGVPRKDYVFKDTILYIRGIPNTEVFSFMLSFSEVATGE
jgi:hypothetical protein